MSLKLSGLIFISFFSLNVFAARTITVSGYGSARSYCGPNSGSFCMSSVKRNAESNAGSDARRNCELFNRGRSLSYTLSYSSSCTPSYIPPNHNGVWVGCNANARMQCEVER